MFICSEIYLLLSAEARSVLAALGLQPAPSLTQSLHDNTIVPCPCWGGGGGQRIEFSMKAAERERETER